MSKAWNVGLLLFDNYLNQFSSLRSVFIVATISLISLCMTSLQL